VLEIRVDGGVGAFAPGDGLSGTLRWVGDAAPEAVELRLLWYTEGRGDRDVGVARTLRIETPTAVGSSSFDFEAPAGPYSCSGRLVSIRWVLEAVTQPGREATRAELVLAPGGREVELRRPHS
jgi:hypothetical protein